MSNLRSSLYSLLQIRNVSTSNIFSSRWADWIRRPKKVPEVVPEALSASRLQPPSTPQPNVFTTVQSSNSHQPLILSRDLDFLPPPHQLELTRRPITWLETLRYKQNIKLGLVDLHPDLFSSNPRLDLIYKNLKWQATYRLNNYMNVRTRAELLDWSNKRPWPKQGTGRARHGTVKSVIWGKGAESHGPRGPLSLYHLPPESVRVWGLRAALSVKLAQDTLHVVDSLELPSDEPQYLEELLESRFWGLSVLFVDIPDVMPRAIAVATGQCEHLNLMPLYGLNVYSLLKHDHLVITLRAVLELEHQLLARLHQPSTHTERIPAHASEPFATPTPVADF